MTRTLGVALIGICFCAICDAQKPIIVSVPSIKTDMRHDAILQDKTKGFYVVTNLSRSAIVTMHISYGCGPITQYEIYDGLEFVPDTPIDYQQTRTLRWIGSMTSHCPQGVDAALFADGHIEGNPVKIADIYLSRRGINDGITFLLPLLNTVVQSETQRGTVLAEIADEIHRVSGPLPAPVIERSMESFVLGAIAKSLQDENDILFPSDRPNCSGSQIETVMKAENINRTKANAFILRRKLLDWQTLLAGNVGPR